MANLDDPETYAKLDPSGMAQRIRELPLQCRQAREQGSRLKLGPEYQDIDKVVIAGMGGSAIGGDLFRSLAYKTSQVPIAVIRDYDLPAYVDERTLVIASSYSGNTEETLSAFAQALGRKAKTIAITSGGKLKALAEEQALPIVSLDVEAEPRATLWHSLGSLLGLMEGLEFLPPQGHALDEALDYLQQLIAKVDIIVPTEQNPAKLLAWNLYGRVTVVYGAEHLTEVAHRWKTQLNENSKAWAFYEAFPELNHNSIVGYQWPFEAANPMLVVFLQSPSFPSAITTRYKVTQELLDKAAVTYKVVEASAGNHLSQMLELILLGDFTSYYLALLYDTDPSPVAAIDYLKSQLGDA